MGTIFAFQFTECMIIGRDLVRLLQNVARIPDFEKLWRDMLFNPTSLSPTFTGRHKILICSFILHESGSNDTWGQVA